MNLFLTYEEWTETAIVKSSVCFGFLNQYVRETYDMLGHTIFIETHFPLQVLRKPSPVRIVCADYNMVKDHPIMRLAESFGAKWWECPYGDGKHGCPVFKGEDGEKACFAFFQKLNSLPKSILNDSCNE